MVCPMDGRVIASNIGINDYCFMGIGGESWSTPYFAGLYAMACQVKKSIKLDEFYALIIQTGDKITEGNKVVGIIPNMERLKTNIRP